jgi:acetyltransferase-like isoleucine patch superfamily enzyme
VARQHLPYDWFDQPLPDGVRLGERSWLYSSFAFLHCKSRQPSAVATGRDSGIYNGTFFDLGPRGEVVLGDYCSIVGAIFCTNRRIRIGNFVFISHEVVLADQDTPRPWQENKNHVAHGDSPEDGIVIGNDVWIGAQATIVGHVSIGAGAIIGAAAVVRDNVPPFSIYVGNPGRIVGSVKRHSVS